MARTGYDDEVEAAAELFGTSLARLGAIKTAPLPDGELGRLAEVLR